MCQSIEAFSKLSRQNLDAVKITGAEMEASLKSVSQWTVEEDGKSIARKFKFCNFVEAIGFISETAFIAERLNHHPDWRNVHGTVSVKLTTYELGGISNLDFELATAMDQIASRRSRPVSLAKCSGRCP